MGNERFASSRTAISKQLHEHRGRHNRDERQRGDAGKEFPAPHFLPAPGLHAPPQRGGQRYLGKAVQFLAHVGGSFNHL